MNNLTIDKGVSGVIEISSIDYNFFLLFKNNVTVEEKLQKQINKIFDRDYRDNYNKKVIKHYDKYTVVKNTKHKEKQIIRKFKDKKLEMFALLNKLTKINFDYTLKEIQNLINKDKTVLIDSIDNFWNFCYKQSIYSIMYIEILKTIFFNQKDKSLEKIIIDKLKNIINVFLSNELYIKNITDDYDVFCDNVKKEKYIKGKIITICWIIQNTSFNIITNLELLSNIKQDFDNELILDIFQIYNTIIGLDNKLVTCMKKYKENKKDINNINKFKIMNIIENKPFQIDGYTIKNLINNR
jgi:hypothetical protein